MKPQVASAKYFDKLKEQGDMLCVNHTEIKLYGPNENTPHRRVELLFVPEECENCTAADLKEIKEGMVKPGTTKVTAVKVFNILP